jgi:hypothetical protein
MVAVRFHGCGVSSYCKGHVGDFKSWNTLYRHKHSIMNSTNAGICALCRRHSMRTLNWKTHLHGIYLFFGEFRLNGCRWIHTCMTVRFMVYVKSLSTSNDTPTLYTHKIKCWHLVIKLKQRIKAGNSTKYLYHDNYGKISIFMIENEGIILPINSNYVLRQVWSHFSTGDDYITIWTFPE